MDLNINNTPVIVAIILFFVISMIIGISSTKKASAGFLSFMIADKSLPWWAIAGSAYATYAGTITYMAWVGSSGMMGLSAGWQFTIHATGFMMMGVFMVPILSRMRRVTLAEPLGERFDPGMRRIASAISFIALIGNNANQILGLGVIVSTFSSLNLVQACVISTICLILYVSLGGMYGVARSDTFQGLLMVIFTFVSPFVVLATIGGGNMSEGFTTVWNALPTKHLSMVNTNASQLSAWLLIMPFTNLLRPELYGRIFSAKNPKEGIKGWSIATALIVLTMIPVLILGLCCKYVIPDYEGAADAYGSVMFNQVAPTWLTVFFVIVVVAAAASTASSQMLGYSSHYVTDFHIPIFYKGKTPDGKRLVLISRIAIIVFTLVGLWWAIAWSDLLTIFNFIFTILVCGILMPYVGLFFWPRMTTIGAKTSSILGVAIAIIWNFILSPKGLLPGVLAKVPAAVPAFTIAVLSAIIVSLATKPEYEKAEEFAKTYKLDRVEKWAASHK